jgi:hypothetical protein
MGKSRNARTKIVPDAESLDVIVNDEPFLSAKELNGKISNSA